MPYFIQVKDKPWDDKSWKIRKNASFETVEAAQEVAEKAFLKPGRDYRVVESYTVTRYKPVKM